MATIVVPYNNVASQIHLFIQFLVIYLFIRTFIGILTEELMLTKLVYS